MMVRSLGVSALIRSSQTSSHKLGCGMASMQMCGLLMPLLQLVVGGCRGRSTDTANAFRVASCSMQVMAPCNNLAASIYAEGAALLSVPVCVSNST